jgi:hypothetical protein
MAYGRVCANLDGLQAVEEASWRGELRLCPEWDEFVARANAYEGDARAELEDAIPPDWSGHRPRDWRLAITHELCLEVERRIEELSLRGVVLDPDTTVASLVIHASRYGSETWGGGVPDYTGRGDYDRQGNVSIHSALRLGADLLVTKNPDVLRTRYLPSAHLDTVIARLRRDGLALEDVDTSVLERLARSAARVRRRRPDDPEDWVRHRFR